MTLRHCSNAILQTSPANKGHILQYIPILWLNVIDQFVGMFSTCKSWGKCALCIPLFLSFKFGFQIQRQYHVNTVSLYKTAGIPLKASAFLWKSSKFAIQWSIAGNSVHIHHLQTQTGYHLLFESCKNSNPSIAILTYESLKFKPQKPISII